MFSTPGFNPCWILPRSTTRDANIMQTNMKRFGYWKSVSETPISKLPHGTFQLGLPNTAQTTPKPCTKACHTIIMTRFTVIVRIYHNHLLETKIVIYTYKTLKISSGSIIHQHSVEKKPRIKWKIKFTKKCCQNSCKLMATKIMLALHSCFTRYLFR